MSYHAITQAKRDAGAAGASLGHPARISGETTRCGSGGRAGEGSRVYARICREEQGQGKGCHEKVARCAQTEVQRASSPMAHQEYCPVAVHRGEESCEKDGGRVHDPAGGHTPDGDALSLVGPSIPTARTTRRHFHAVSRSHRQRSRLHTWERLDCGSARQSPEERRDSRGTRSDRARDTQTRALSLARVVEGGGGE